MSFSHPRHSSPQPGSAGLARAGDTVSATISQDRAEGATAAEESSFGMLTAGGGRDAGSSPSINPALIADTTTQAPNVYWSPGPPPDTFGAPHLPPNPYMPWHTEESARNDLVNHQPHALQDYQMQLMLLEQQNKKRLMMARQEQDAIAPPAEDDEDDQPRMTPHSKRPVTTGPQEQPGSTSAADASADTLKALRQKQQMAIAAHQARMQQMARQQAQQQQLAQQQQAYQFMQHQQLMAQSRATPDENTTQGGRDAPSSSSPQPAAAISSEVVTQEKSELSSEKLSAAAMTPGSAPRLLASVSPRSRQAALAKLPSATAPVFCSQSHPMAVMPKGVVTPPQTLIHTMTPHPAHMPPNVTPYQVTAHQVAAQRDAMVRAAEVARKQLAERQRWQNEANDRFKAQAAQMMEWQRKMIPLGPGQTFPGPPAILMAQHEKTLFPDGPSEPNDQSGEKNQTRSPEGSKGDSQPQDANIPDILMPHTGFPLFDEQGEASKQAQPNSPGNGRKRSLDESHGNAGLVEATSHTDDSRGNDSESGSSLREKRTRIVPISSEPPNQIESNSIFTAPPEDFDWECIGLSPDLGNLGITLDIPSTEPGAPQPPTNQQPKAPDEARSMSSTGTLPELDDALMMDADETSRQTDFTKDKGKEDSDTSTTSNAVHRQYFRTLHSVHCSKTVCRGKIYADVPQLSETSAAGPGHMTGGTVISDLQAYVAQEPHVAWVVFRDYQCPQQTGRNWNKPNESDGNEIRVVSDELKHTITQVSRCVSDQGLQNRSQASTFNRPPPPEGVYRPRFLYHHRDVLRDIVAKDPPRADVAALLWFVEHESPDASKLQECDVMFAQGKVSKSTLPWLFCPNTIIISTKQGPDSNIPAAYVLEDWPFEIDGGLQLNGWSWGYDGQKLQRRQTCLTVKVAMDDTVDITSLSVYPATFMDLEMKIKLAERGRQFWGYRHRHHVSYQGWDYQKERKYGEGSRCMVDYQTYRKFHSTASAFAFSHAAKALYDQWPESISNTKTLSEDNLMLLPPDIHGFFLKEKRWVVLCLDQITPVTWNKLAFDRLVLPQKTKTLVQAMVMPRANRDAEAEPEVRGDLIAGKGNGLIMLLHGPPGTGKTLTAESVAELAEMPLYSVTCGDIGTSPEAVERYLNTVLHLGKTWNCVLLLDEADVFLEQRSMADLDRNSLVSVFLRTLEYYSGILILTSNRVSIFDEAFKSRIQVALSYPRLDKPSRKRVWYNFINMVHEDGGRQPKDNGGKFPVDYTGIVAHMDDLASRELNGRQIRNAMATARQLAGYLGETLSWEHLETAITTASDFTTG